MRIEVLCTGTELLLGNVVNRHLRYFAQRLFPMRLQKEVIVPDGPPIRDALIDALPRSDVLLVTGGLGPTTDDVTRETAAELLGRPLELHEETLAAIKARCARRGFPFQERMTRQAMAPRGSQVLPNEFGTAPGLYLPPSRHVGCPTPHIFLMPGPPRELYPIFERHVEPILRQIGAKVPGVECRVYRCIGMGESLVEKAIGLSLSQRGDLEIGYCARPNEVDFRLIGTPAILEEVEPAVLESLGEHLVCIGDTPLEALVVAKLREGHLTVATAESCTGGLISNRITDVPGASEVFLSGMVSYSNAAKVSCLGVDASLIEEHGAVSDPVARAMAEGAVAKAGTDFGLSTTGIAGPGGGSPEKPIGTVYLALARKNGPTRSWREFFPTDRETFKQLASQAALFALFAELRHGGRANPTRQT